MKKTTAYIDMDGTVYPLYQQENWLNRLENSDPSVFSADEAMVSEATLLSLFPTEKYTIKVLSMTPKNASKEYCEKVIEAKNAWLDKFFPSIKERIYLPYGNNKNLKNSSNAILIDDNKEIRENFRGLALDPMALWG